jgi:hypothetical protein
MRTAIRLMRHARQLLEDDVSRTRGLWNDATAVRFRDRYYKPTMDAFEKFSHAADDLADAIEEAEAVS